ncbi:MAG: class I SAM-dependent methyltransferase [Verrucomicrobiales bacterium]
MDATAGNGHDTLFLASLVSPGGTVHAFDVQMKALHRTEERLREKGVRDGTVILHHIGHEFAAATLAAAGVIAIRAAMFNLGYLPRGDPAIITQPNTTIRAVADMLSLLDSQGIITLVMYVGHPGGESEAAALRAFIQQIPTSEFMARHYRPAPHRDHSPELIVIERLDGTCGT